MAIIATFLLRHKGSAAVHVNGSSVAVNVLGHSVSIQQIFWNFPARPSQNLMKFAGSVHQIFIRKCTKFQDDIFSSF